MMGSQSGLIATRVGGTPPMTANMTRFLPRGPTGRLHSSSLDEEGSVAAKSGFVQLPVPR